MHCYDLASALLANGNFHEVTRNVITQKIIMYVRCIDFMPVDLDDHIALFEAHAASRATSKHIVD